MLKSMPNKLKNSGEILPKIIMILELLISSGNYKELQNDFKKSEII